MLGLWVSLALVGWLLVQPVAVGWFGTLCFCLLLATPALAVWLTGRAAAALPANRLARWAFWTVTAAGWLIVGLLAAGRYEKPPMVDERTTILLAGLFAVLLPTWVAVRARTFPTWQAVRDGAVGVGIATLAAAAMVWIYNAKTESIATRAEVRWTELGLSLTEFEKSLAPVHETSGSEVAREVFRTEIGQHFYRAGTPAAERDPAPAPSQALSPTMEQVIAGIIAQMPPGDEMKVEDQPMELLEERSAALEDAFRRLLAAETPAWAFDPADGSRASIPNFLAIRTFCQLAAAESVHCLASGDEAGAARAIEAGLRVRTGLKQSPLLVSLMIQVAVDALLGAKQVRLPASGDELAVLAGDTVEMRRALLRTLQWESMVLLRDRRSLHLKAYGMASPDRALPKWASAIFEAALIQRECAVAAFVNAEHAAIEQAPETLRSDDLGQGLHEEITRKFAPTFAVNFTRCAMRMEVTLLLREQAALIRAAREKLAAGRPVESRDSIVIPGLRWEVTADPAKMTVTMRLANAPQWIVDQRVTGNDFWPLPIDGSVAWQFRTPDRAAAAAR